MAVEYAVRGYPHIEYDGTNSADVLAAAAEFWSPTPGPSIISETGGVLTISSGQTINDPVGIAVGSRLDILGWLAVTAADWAKYVKA